MKNLIFVLLAFSSAYADDGLFWDLAKKHGCYQNKCYSYKFGFRNGAEDPWCYTRDPSKPWGTYISCQNDIPCTSNLHCVDNKLFFGSDPEQYVTLKESISHGFIAKPELDILLIRLHAQKDLEVAQRKFDNTLKALTDKYENLVKVNSDNYEAEIKALKSAIRDLCDMAGVRVPEAYRE